jgi:uncharacterized protein YicC (UPF0701 family)
MRAIKSYALLLLLAIPSLSGCETVTHLDELLTLKSVSDSQKDIDKYLAEQEKGFQKLLDDLKNNRLKEGMTKKYIIATYAEPILVEQNSEDPRIKEVLLYRHPTQYFKSDRIYLYLDKNRKLLSWQLKPAE